MHLILVQLANSSSELIAFHPVQKKLRNLLAPPLILSSRRSLLFFLLLVFVVHGPEPVLGVPRLVLGFGVLSLDLPYALFLEGKRPPAIAYARHHQLSQGTTSLIIRALTDNLGKRTMVSLNGPWNVFLTDKVRPEQHKRVRGTWDVT
jgi:hypothetical protein